VNPIAASRAAEETLNTECLVRECGEDWATNSSTPYAFVADGDLHIPLHYAEAMRCPDLWEGSMQEELENLCSCGVVKGFSQIQGEDFNKTYAVVAQLESFRIAMAVAAQKGMKIWQVDFVSAYLNSDCQYDIYMELPPGFAPQGEDNEDGIALQVERSEGEQGNDEEHVLIEGGEPGDDEECVLLLLKTIYGMMQGVYDWFYLLNNMFAALRYYQSKADLYVWSCLINGEYTLMSTHMDNVFGASTTEDGATEAKAELDRCFEIKDLGTLSIILGIKISQDSVTGSISLTQKAYLKRTLEHFGMANCNPKSTPLPPGIDISDDLCPKTKEDR